MRAPLFCAWCHGRLDMRGARRPALAEVLPHVRMHRRCRNTVVLICDEMGLDDGPDPAGFDFNGHEYEGAGA